MQTISHKLLILLHKLILVFNYNKVYMTQSDTKWKGYNKVYMVQCDTLIINI